MSQFVPSPMPSVHRYLCYWPTAPQSCLNRLEDCQLWGVGDIPITFGENSNLHCFDSMTSFPVSPHIRVRMLEHHPSMTTSLPGLHRKWHHTVGVTMIFLQHFSSTSLPSGGEVMAVGAIVGRSPTLQFIASVYWPLSPHKSESSPLPLISDAAHEINSWMFNNTCTQANMYKELRNVSQCKLPIFQKSLKLNTKVQK